MKELRLKKLTQARMEQWLREHPAKKFHTNNVFYCPIAQFIQGVYPNAKLHSVGMDGGNITTKTTPGDQMRRFLLPRWAKAFVRRVDREDGYSVKITSKQALAILTSI